MKNSTYLISFLIETFCYKQNLSKYLKYKTFLVLICIDLNKLFNLYFMVQEKKIVKHE